MTKHFFSFLLFIMLLSLPLKVSAIKATPHPMIVTQPDGKTITVRLKGDEFHHYYTTIDGYLIKKNQSGFFVYEAIESEEIIARDLSKRTNREKILLENAIEANLTTLRRSQANAITKNSLKRANRAVNNGFPLTGSPKSLVILVNFKDKSFVVSNPKTAFSNLLNEEAYSTNGGTGSARDYFKSASYGQFSPQFDVVGPYTLPQNMAYYGGNVSNEDKNPQQMVIDACNLANQNGLDFTEYDTDDNGMLDNVFIYYAGFNEAEDGGENTVWPHRWTLDNENTKFDGKIIYDYACTSELQGNSGSDMCGIGTFCHEFGHVLGLPDYYHTEKDANTLNDWSIMDSGGYLNNGRTPPTYSVYDRFFLGWLSPTEINSGSTQTLLPIYQGTTPPADTNQQAYLLSASTHNLIGNNPTPKEFFMLEYRKKTGWDSYLPSEGMLVWHIDYDQTAWDDNSPNNYSGSNQTSSSHMRVYLQPLSGSSSTPGSAFSSGSIIPTTWSGTNINRPLTRINKTASHVVFDLMGGALSAGISTSGNINPFYTIQGTATTYQSLAINATLLTSNLSISFNNEDHFEMKLSTESTWSKSLTITPVSGNINKSLQIRYNPLLAGSHTVNLLLVSTGVDLKTIAIQANSTAPYIPGTPYLATGMIENSLVFPSIKISTTKTKTLNLKTTDLIGNLSLQISGVNANLFSLSTSSVAKNYTNAQAGANINISYMPVTVGTHSATLTISGGGLPAKVIQLSGEGLE